ncbi:MAG: rRNA maturation RNase YbeY [Calditrichaeota bacterium]|nr:rRNA maturation RNase YbeY [Calditrichota bacterium]
MSERVNAGRRTGHGGVFVEFEEAETDPHLALALTSAMKLAIGGEGRRIGGLTVILTGDAVLQELNRQYLELDEVTDVLAFDVGDEGSETVEGDVYISVLQAGTQAAVRGEAVNVEIVRLAVHGVLHLCGWDHDDEGSLAEMVEHGEGYVQELISRGLLGR